MPNTAKITREFCSISLQKLQGNFTVLFDIQF